jgi:hypothetical protein
VRSKLLAGGLSLLAISLSVLVLPRRTQVTHAAQAFPAYAPNGDLLPIANYREWVYLSSGIDISYDPKLISATHSMFDNVFVDPEAYRSYMATGTWPDKTILVLEIRDEGQKGSIVTRGHYQSEGITGFEVHVKDESRYPGRWAFYDSDSPKQNARLVPEKAPCYSCHAQHAAVDTVFVQFYPTLLPVAREKQTFSAEYLKERAAAAKKK